MLGTDETKTKSCLDIAEGDILLPHADLPLRGTYFPLGFPLEMSSNSQAVMAAAEESWKHFDQKFSDTALQFRMAVQSDDDNNFTLPAAPVCTLQWNFLLQAADAYNFVICDLENGRSFGSITQSMAESPVYFRYHFLEAAALSMVTALRAAPVHAACVSPFGCGMLLCGYSGAGKSSLAYAGARAGWIFVSDDASYLPLNQRDRLAIGNCHQIRFRSRGIELFPELEGRPIISRATGKPSIEVPTAELRGLVTADSAIVEYIIFLNRQDPGAETLVPLAKSSALPWFRQWCSTAGSQSRGDQEAALERLLTAPIYELRYRDLDWAVARLEQLAVTGR